MAWVNLTGLVGLLVCGLGYGFMRGGWLGLFGSGMVIFGGVFMFTTIIMADRKP